MIQDPSKFHLVTQVIDLIQHVSPQAQTGHVATNQAGFELSIGPVLALLFLIMFLGSFVHLIGTIIMGFIDQGVKLLRHASEMKFTPES